VPPARSASYAAAVPFVNRSGDDEDEERASAVAPGAPPFEWDPNDPDTVKVHYDVSAWPFDERAELTSELAELGYPHRWEGDELVVPEELETEVDELFERLEAELGPFAVPLAAEAESTEFELDEWPADDLELLRASLIEAEIPHRWSGSTVVVARDAEAAVDDLLDAIERGDIASVDEASGPPEGALSRLFTAADRLARDPTDAAGRDDLFALVPTIEPRQAPFGVAVRTWSQIVGAAQTLHADFHGDNLDASDVIGHAQQLRTLTRPFV
jgi:hypothetical protein